MRGRELITPLAIACALALAACGSSSSSSSSSSSTRSASRSTTSSGTPAHSGPTVGFEHIPLQIGPALGPGPASDTGPVDGIQCKASEQLAYHIHVHLAVFRDGTLSPLPAGIGIPGSRAPQTNDGPVAVGGRCYYWLHTHTTDGIIHIESPTRRIYRLGDFFDVWRQPLSGGRVASLRGPITALVNGKAWTRSPRAIPLFPHELIQLEIGQPTPPLVTVRWAGTGL